MPIDCYNDPYNRRATARRMRTKFNAQKLTMEFEEWRTLQKRIQKNHCAWCRINLGIDTVVTHIDHVTPLYFDGSNDFSNLVLSCKRCNVRKWVRNDYVMPGWILKRKEGVERRMRLEEARIAQELQAERILDSMVADELGWLL